MLVLLVAWAALVLAVGQLACGDEHDGGDGLESAACLILAVAAIARVGLPSVRRMLRVPSSMRFTASSAYKAVVVLTADAARGSPVPTSSPLRC